MFVRYLYGVVNMFDVHPFIILTYGGRTDQPGGKKAPRQATLHRLVNPEKVTTHLIIGFSTPECSSHQPTAQTQSWPKTSSSQE